MRDLSHPIRDRMPVYPGDPDVRIEPALDLDRDGVRVARLHLGSHSGTHVDAPAHTVPGGRTMAEVALDELVGDALVVHLGEVPAGAVIDTARLLAAVGGEWPDPLPPIVVLDSGWADRFDGPDAVRHPALDPDAAAELVARGMHVLAVDTLSPDQTEGGEGFPVHEVVLGADRLIVENIANLAGLPERVRIGFFPLPLDGDGAPVRAVAMRY